MSISFGSINTGLPKDIVQQIIKAEQIPIERMEARKSKISDRQTLVNQLGQLVEGIRGDVFANSDDRSFREFLINTRDDIIDVSFDKSRVQPGSYQLEVVQMARKSSAMTSGFEDPENSYVGVGYIQYRLPNGDWKDVYIDSSNSSLNDIAKLINRDTSNGMRANVINDGSGGKSPWRLLLSLEETGDQNLADFPYFYFVDGEQDFYLEKERHAQDAIVKIDGFEVEFPTNTITDVIPGVTFDLKKAAPGEEFSLKIGEDSSKITEKISAMVDKINEVLQFIKQQNTLDENSDTGKTLGGDILLQTIEGKIRSSVFMPVETEFGMRRVSDFGVQFQKSGLLELDDKKFEEALKSNYKMISQVMVGKYDIEEGKVNGFINNLADAVNSILRFPDGSIQLRKQSLRSNIEQIDRQIEQKQRNIAKKEEQLKDKFARLEGTISKIKNQGAGLAGLGSGTDNFVTQLG
ncbi:MAG: flagellar filament capping protein FliD [Halobacteriovoraceae bacterium]|nr:flagellar filament capping protein FliD [Halobacteriovoraceae bacterium]